MTFLFGKWLKETYPSRWLSPLRRAWGAWLGLNRHPPSLRRPLLLEPLEGRRVPATITPTTFADGGLGSGSLRDAVMQFNADTGTADDIIQLLPGTYSLAIRNVNGRHETAGLTGDLNLTQTSHRWIIQGAGPSTIIDASQLQDRVFEIVNPGTQVVFQDLVIQGGLAQDDGSDGALAGTTAALGGGILNNGADLTLDDVVLQNNVARGGDTSRRTAPGYDANGGGIYSMGGALTLAGATIANNQATGGRGGDSSLIYYAAGAGGLGAGAGLYASGGSLDISDSTITNNQATGGRGGDGGFYGTFTTSGSYHRFGLGGSGGRAQGGGLFVNGGSLSVASSTIASNHGTGGPGGVNGDDSFGAGGGLYLLSNAGTATVTDIILSGNSAADGGGIDNGGTLTVSNSILSGNSVSSSDYAGVGGGIDNGGTATVSNSTLSGNSAYYDGGGIENDGTATVSNSTLSGNSAHYGGGGIENDGTATVSNSTLSGNSAGGGGGIDNSPARTLTVTNSTISGNSAGLGGGVDNRGGTLTVSDSTLSGNSADGNHGGGGIESGGTSPVTLTNVTLTANRADSGGGLYVGSGSPVLHNTLIAGNFRGAIGTTPDDVYGRLDPSGSYNLIGDGTGMTGLSDGVNGNQVGSDHRPIDPRLGPLQDNGGPTFSLALLPGSPALNAGDPAQLGTADQRGVSRTGAVNIGAYQASATSFVLTAPDTVTPGVRFDVTVTAVDPFGQVAVGYTGTITFSTTDPDPRVVLPADYRFRPGDAGQVTFHGGVTLITPGDQLLTVMDTADNTITGSALVTVGSAAPGAGAQSPGQPPPGGWPDSAAPASEPSPGQVAAVDGWFAALNPTDVGFTWAPPIRDVRAEADGWALDPWWAGAPWLLVERG
jgi:hypothetical protein